MVASLSKIQNQRVRRVLKQHSDPMEIQKIFFLLWGDLTKEMYLNIFEINFLYELKLSFA